MVDKQWLTNQSENLVSDIIKENDIEKFQALENKFKLNQRKKNIVRADRLTKALEMADNEIINRLEAEPEGWKNDELLKYTESSQRAIDSILNTDDKPLIQINNTELNINSTGLNRDSREKVLKAIQEILDNKDIIDVEVK